MAASVDQSIDNVSPKRVIIRLQQSDFNDRDPELPARIYLEKFRSLNEFGENRHFIHIQPPSPGNNDNDDNGNSNDNREKLQFPENDYKIHVIIDIEKDQFSGPLGEDFPHEMYRLKRVDGDLRLCTYRDDAWNDNFLRKYRAFTDELYPWGMTRRDYYLRIND